MNICLEGKNKALEDLERAKKLIEEAGKILWHLPFDLKVVEQTADEDDAN